MMHWHGEEKLNVINYPSVRCWLDSNNMNSEMEFNLDNVAPWAGHFSGDVTQAGDASGWWWDCKFATCGRPQTALQVALDAGGIKESISLGNVICGACWCWSGYRFLSWEFSKPPSINFSDAKNFQRIFRVWNHAGRSDSVQFNPPSHASRLFTLTQNHCTMITSSYPMTNRVWSPCDAEIHQTRSLLISYFQLARNYLLLVIYELAHGKEFADISN